MTDNSAEALSRALDLANNGVTAAFETVRQNAPAVWEVARRQTQVDGYELLLCALFTIICGTVIIYSSSRCLNKDDSDWDSADHAWATILVTFFGGGVVLALVINAMDLIRNPDWWTIKRVIEITYGHRMPG